MRLRELSSKLPMVSFPNPSTPGLPILGLPWVLGAQISLGPPPAGVYKVLCCLSNCSPGASKILLTSETVPLLLSYSCCSCSSCFPDFRFAVVVVGLQKTVEVTVVTHPPLLATSLPEHFSCFPAHSVFLTDVRTCSLLNDFLQLLPTSAHRVGTREFGSTRHHSW